MQSRIEGATLPGYTATITDDQGASITDGLSYTWTCQASAQVSRGTVFTQLWVKSTGITATVSGFTVAWLTADIGSLTAVNALEAVYVLEFTGVNGSNLLKHQETVKIRPQIP